MALKITIRLICLHFSLIRAVGATYTGHRRDPDSRRAESKAPEPAHEPVSELVCTPFGGCEPCPPDAVSFTCFDDYMRS